MSVEKNLLEIKASLPETVTLVAVSKTKPVEDLMEAYNAGQRIFGENKVQEMSEKYAQMPKDIEWHMIGHLQSNKVRIMAPFVSLVHGVDSLKLLEEINKEAIKNDRIIDVLLQIHIAAEETKFGLDKEELETILKSESFINMKNIRLKGLMGIATFTDDEDQIKSEFSNLKELYDKHSAEYNLSILSMGMSGDYETAIDCGSTMVRIGSSIFGTRNYN